MSESRAPGREVSFDPMAPVALMAKGAADTETQCFAFALDPSRDPSAMPLTEDQDGLRPAETREPWCYRPWGPGYSLVYDVGGPRLAAESIYLVEHGGARGDGAMAVRYGSLTKGVTRFFRTTDLALAPIQVPLTKEAAAAVGLRLDASLLADRYGEALRLVANQLGQVEATPSAVREVIPGTFSAHLPEDRYPHAAHWWPHDTLELAAGDEAPLGKYDRAIRAYRGQDPRSRDWEARYHSLEGVPWGGHCNGWAASSVLYKEVTQPLWDARSRQVFLTSDINGILAEASFCVHWAFYGTRYNGREGEDMTDIHPPLFHKVLRQVIGLEGKPVAMDYMPHEGVDNAVITGYRMTVTADPADSHKFAVTTWLQRHDYEFERNEDLGPAPHYEVAYRYSLVTDDEGRIVDGTWESDNPDFLWVPLGQRACGRENPRIDHVFVEETLMRLPPAQRVNHLSQEITLGELAPGASAVLWQGALPGAYPRLRLRGTGRGYPLDLVVRAHALYPWEEETKAELVYDLSGPGMEDLLLPVGSVTEISVRNRAGEAQPAGLIGLELLESLAGPAE